MNMLSINNVTFKHAANQTPILEALNLTIQSGEMTVLLGRNGAGKSSLLKLLTRQYFPASGHIQLDGQDLNVYPQKTFYQQVNGLNQHCDESLFPALTVLENYCMMQPHGKLYFSKKSQEKSLQALLNQYNPNLAAKLHCPVNRLSGGEKQALALAFCLLNPPKLLLLDEHTSALDPKASASLMALTYKMVLEKGVTCLLTTHDLEIALRYGHKIIMLEAGKVVKIFNEDEKKQLSKDKLLAYY